MKKRGSVLMGSLLSLLLLTSCSQSDPVDVTALQDELSELKTKVEQLETDNESLSKKNDDLLAQIERLQEEKERAEEEKKVNSDDITVVLTGKSTSEDDYNIYVDFEFSVTNNTDKAVKGIQGEASFMDIFGSEILAIKCDFTEVVIEPGATVKIDDLYLKCNQFKDDNMELYTTTYEYLTFDYNTTSIVFTDGTIKK